MSEPSDSETPEQRLAAARSWAEGVEPTPSRSGAAGAEMSARVQAVIEAAERAADAIREDAEEQAQRHLVAAQQKADRMTAERVQLISRLTDDLVQHATVVREHSERMVSSLEEAINTVTARLQDEQLLSSPEPPSLSFTEGAATPPSDVPAPAAEPASTPAPAPEPVPAPQPTAEPRDQPVADVGVERAPGPRSDAPPAPPAQPAPEPASPPQAAPTESPPPPGVSVGAEGAEPSVEAMLRATQLAVAGHGREEIAGTISEEFGIDPEPVLARVLD